MNNTSKQIFEKLENHKKLLSLVSDQILPIKQILLNDVNDIERILEHASKDKHK